MRRNNTANLSLDTKLKIKELYEQGVSPYAIARRLKVSCGTVYKYRHSPKGRKSEYQRKTPIKTYCFVSPEGVEHKTNNITKFSMNYNLDPSRLYKLVIGKNKTHKGWTFSKVEVLSEYDD